MPLEAPLVGEGEHLVVHPRRVADAEHVDTAVHEFLRDPVHRHVALGAHQHLALTAQRLVDGFHEGGGLARAWGTVDDGYVLRPQHLVDGILLRRIQIGEMHRGKGEGLRPHASPVVLALRRGVEEVSEIRQPSFRPHHPVEGLEHHLVTRLVEVELHADVLRALHVDELPVIRHRHYHPVAIDETDRPSKGEIGYPRLS